MNSIGPMQCPWELTLQPRPWMTPETRWLMMSSHCLILMYDCLSRCFRGYTWGCGLQEDLVGHHLGGPPQVNGDYSPPPLPCRNLRKWKASLSLIETGVIEIQWFNALNTKNKQYVLCLSCSICNCSIIDFAFQLV